jgi:hypothetical protein
VKDRILHEEEVEGYSVRVVALMNANRLNQLTTARNILVPEVVHLLTYKTLT